MCTIKKNKTKNCLWVACSLSHCSKYNLLTCYCFFQSKTEHKVHFEKLPSKNWSPYGCHYYPDSKAFPSPNLDSLPNEPLLKGEQYFLDLAGNIRKVIHYHYFRTIITILYFYGSLLQFNS